MRDLSYSEVSRIPLPILNEAGNWRVSMTEGQDEITTAIEQLRAQLTAVQERSADAKLRFAVTEVEIEFLVEVTKDGGGSGGVRLGLVTVGADGRLSKGNSHRLKLRLDVQDSIAGGQAIVSDRR